MKTYSGSDAGSLIEPMLQNPKKSIWVISPWLGKKYAEQLGALSQKGIEVRIITSNQDSNIESLEILKASENPNLLLVVLSKEKLDMKPTFVHAKIYIADNERAISGSANLTYSGLHSNVESLSIAETKEEVEQIEMEFRRIWMEFENKSMSKEELSSGTSFAIKNALLLPPTVENIVNNPNIMGKELIYHPYYFFEFIFRGSVRSPPIQFRDSGFVVLDGITRQIINDNRLVEEINNNPKADYLHKTEDKYRLTILKSIVQNYQEARELVLDYIITKNTRNYLQTYQNRGGYGGVTRHNRLYVPRPYEISFVKSDFVQVPIWYLDMRESGGKKLQKLVFGSSEKLWDSLLYCPECQSKIWVRRTIQCQSCGKEVCPNCIKQLGFVLKKKVCKSCVPK